MPNTNVTSIQLPGTIYGTIIAPNSDLIIDIRDVEKQSISYYSLDLHSLQLKELSIHNKEWWTKLISADNESLYLTKYQDRNDPNSQIHVRLPLNGSEHIDVKEVPLSDVMVDYPVLYESETEHHKTVSEFLGLELPLSCEYLEWKEKIIISYYLRSGNAFDRFLLLLDNGKKEWKLHQDHQMKGFSPGAFFIYQDQLIFFKELNEVCIYAL